MPKGKLFVVNNCRVCPNLEKVRTVGAGYALDWLCKAAPKKTKNGGLNMIAGYVEWPSEEPKDFEFPSFCPLKTEEWEK